VAGRDEVAAVGAEPAGRTARETGAVFLKCLIVLFLLSLPLVNPWVRGDGVGYYAYVHSLLIDHDLHFENEWQAGNPSFRQARVDEQGQVRADQFSPTGYVKNHFSVGPSILWFPFLAAVHGAVLAVDAMGAHVAADGYSRPYLVAMALATAAYGFVGLLLSFDLARRYFAERWAFLATLGIWLTSSLPVYMYFNPSWSHAHSAFAVALFLWYWHRTRGRRTLSQWFVLALMAGLMMNVYYPNAILLLVPGIETLTEFGRALQQKSRKQDVLTSLSKPAFFLLVTGISLLPTFITRRIIYGSWFESDYPAMRSWFWASPKLLPVLFSTDHGMLIWTPILIPSIVGLVLLCRCDKLFGISLVLSFLGYYYFIASYPDWDGLSSFGNRFFVPLTILFILGLSAMLDFLGGLWRQQGRAFAAASCLLGLLVLWNAGLIFQWGTQMIPARGEIPWREVVHNQFAEVPFRVTGGLEGYFERRKSMMQEIEKQDLTRQLRTPAQ